MIEGEVTPERQGVVRLRVSRPGGPSAEIRAAIDTGFTGFLALPTDTITRLGLSLVGARRRRLADGSLMLLNLYLAHVLWDGVLRRVQVLETGGPCLVGVSLLYGYVLTFEAIVCASRYTCVISASESGTVCATSAKYISYNLLRLGVENKVLWAGLPDGQNH